MQAPSFKTPVRDCIRCSIYHRTMLAKLGDQGRLLKRIDPAEAQLVRAQAEYEEAVMKTHEPRVGVRLADYFADSRVTLVYLDAVKSDGGKPGPTTQTLFPNGRAVIIDPIGVAEITEIRHLETRLQEHGGPIASEHLKPLRKVRVEYEGAVAARDAASASVARKRELRNIAKHKWITAYLQNQGAIREAFPHDRSKQELCFDALRPRRAPSETVVAPSQAAPASAAT